MKEGQGTMGSVAPFWFLFGRSKRTLKRKEKVSRVPNNIEITTQETVVKKF